MVKCAKCSKAVTKKCPGVQCSKCNKWHHGSCASLTTEQIAALSATDSVDWKCRGCAPVGKPKRISCILPQPEPEDDEDDPEGTYNKEEMLSIFRQEIREIIRTELQTTLDFYSKKIDDYEERMKEYDSRMKMLENQCTDLKNLHKNLKLQNEVLEQKINKIEQAQSHNDVEICGVAEKENEDPKEIALKICQLLSQNAGDIIRAYRKKKPFRPAASQQTRADSDMSSSAASTKIPTPAPIIVTLSHSSRDAWLTAAKDRRIAERDLGGDSDEKISIRESLSPTTAFLLWKTKSLKEKALCQFVWCKNGSVLVRKSVDDRKVYTVRCVGDIKRIAKELQKK